MEEDVEVIFEAWVLRLTGLDGRSVLRLSSQWKKRYMILIRQHESASILYYGSKPASLNAAPKGIVVLEPYYKVEKRQNVRGQRYVVSLTTPTKRFVVAVEDERIFHLLSFYLQVQVKLNEDVEEECFVVRPDNTDDQRKIGARGNMCLLHISPWGITVALQLSKCVIVQWPLTCIRNYESTGRGQFVVTVGKRAHMGVGRYVFNTRLTQDNVMYDRLDRYVIDAAGMRNSHADSVSQTSVMEQDSLHALTYVQANPQFSNHLRKISRDMYDSLWQHLGGTRVKASNPDLVSDSPHVHQRTFTRTGSMATLDGAAGATASIPTTPRQSLRRKLSSPAAFTLGTSPIRSPDDFSSLPRNFRRTPPSKVTARDSKKRIPVEMIESEYLHPESAYFDSNYENDEDLNRDSAVAMATALPLGASAGSVTSKPPTGNTGAAAAAATGGKQPTTTFKSPHTSVSSEPSQSQSPRGQVAAGTRPRVQRQQSRSCEDLIAYTDMASTSKKGNEYVYNNGTPAEGATPVPNGTDTTDTGAYSYATQHEVELTRAAAQKLAQRRLYVDGSAPAGSGSRDAIPTGYIRKPLVRHSSMKKAMSNPSLLEAEHTQDAHPPAGPESPPPPVTHPAHRPPLPGSGYQKGAPVERTISHSPTRSLPVVMTSSISPLSASMTSPLTSSLGVAVTAGASPMTSRAHFMNTPKGIHTTSKTKVFRKPVTPEHSPSKSGSKCGPGKKAEEHRRQESSSSGYASGGGGGTDTDMRETHC